MRVASANPTQMLRAPAPAPNYNMNFYYFIVSQFNSDIIYSAIIHVSDVSDDADGIFAC
jgi:hypothetical protein